MGILQLMSRLIGASDIAWGTGAFSWVDENSVVHTASEVNASDIPTVEGHTVGALLGSITWLVDGDNFPATVAALGATCETIYLTGGTYAVSTDLTIPVNIKLKVEKCVTITVANGVTLTINGPFEAGLYQVFSCTGTGKVVFGAGAVKEVHPEWWAANTTPGTTDMTAAVKAAAVSVAGGGTVFIQETSYRVSDCQFGDAYSTALTGVTFKGNNRDYCKLLSNSATGMLFEFYKCTSVTLDGLSFDSGAAIAPNKVDAAAGNYSRTVIFWGCTYPTVKNCKFTRGFCESLVFHNHTDATVCSDVVCTDNLLATNYGGGIVCKLVDRATVRGNILTNWNTYADDWFGLWAVKCNFVNMSENVCHLITGTPVPIQASARLEGCINSSFTDNILQSDVAITQGQLSLNDGEAYRAMLNVLVSGNTIKGIGSIGIDAGFTTYANKNISICNNSIYGQPYGIRIAGSVSQVNISGNSIYTPTLSNANVGIGIEATASGVPDYVTISGNNLSGNDKAPTTSIGIFINNAVAALGNLNINGNTISTFYYPVKADYATTWKGSLVGNMVNDVTWTTGMSLGGAAGSMVYQANNVDASTGQALMGSTFNPYTKAFATPYDIDLTKGFYYKTTDIGTAAAVTVNAPTGVAGTGFRMILDWTKTTNALTITWNGVFKADGYTSMTANKRVIMEFMYDGTNWVLVGTPKELTP